MRVLWEFFGNFIGILCGFFGNCFGNSLGILWEFFGDVWLGGSKYVGVDFG